jgi:2-succinyl-6-hydroxy-2,4-cyclohexadiene-1-carboxylate synthase
VRAVLVPGFSQTAESWDTVVATSPGGWNLVPVEVPLAPTWHETAAVLAATGGSGVWVGYSMGGRLALQVALDRPDLVDRLVLVSATAGIRDPAERARRVADDEALIARIERDGVAAFVRDWMARPMFARVPPDASGIAARMRQSADRLVQQLRVLGTGAMPDLWPRLDELTMPVAVVTGRMDEKFSAIGDDLALALPGRARRVELDAGHAIPLEVPKFLHGVL